MAPGLGLYLDELFFEGYNMKQEAELLRMSNRKPKLPVAAGGGGGGDTEETVSMVLLLTILCSSLS